MKTTTHIQARRNAAVSAQERVLLLLSWSELYYCWFKYRTGLAYLDYYVGGDPDGVAMLERSRAFWKWWKNHWTLREEEFLNSEISSVRLSMRRNIYKERNNPHALSLGITPTAVVLDESYAEMIEQVNKEISQPINEEL